MLSLNMGWRHVAVRAVFTPSPCPSGFLSVNDLWPPELCYCKHLGERGNIIPAVKLRS